VDSVLSGKPSAAMLEEMQRLKTRGARSIATFGGYVETWLPHDAKAKPLATKTAEQYFSLAAHATRTLG
jgi:hypothetical protein